MKKNKHNSLHTESWHCQLEYHKNRQVKLHLYHCFKVIVKTIISGLLPEKLWLYPDLMPTETYMDIGRIHTEVSLVKTHL